MITYIKIKDRKIESIIRIADISEEFRENNRRAGKQVRGDDR